jgi:hypothetical protein
MLLLARLSQESSDLGAELRFSGLMKCGGGGGGSCWFLYRCL